MEETALIGCIARVARSGETIDAVTVGKNAMPDDEPITNWSDLSCITNCKFDAVKKTFGTKVCMDDDGNVSEEEIERIIRDGMVFTTQNMSSLVDELQFGLSAAPVVDGAEVEMLAKTDRKIYHWLWVKGVRIGGGGVAKDFKIWGYFTLETAYDFKTDGISETALRFTHERGSSLGAKIKFYSES